MGDYLKLVIFVALILILLLLLLVGRYKKLLKTKLEDKDTLLRNLLAAEKMEREKIASEIHDKLQGDLIAIKNFNFIIKQLKDDHDKLSLYEDLDTTIDSAILNTKAVSHKLMPPMLGKIDFISLLEYYFKTFSLTNGKSFRLTYTNSNFTLPQDKVYESFRIVQLYCDYIQETVSEFNLGYHQDEIAYYIVFTDDAASFSISDCFTSESNYELLSIPVRLTILNAEIMQIDVKVGNHFILKINK